jgi:hypothetical protein
MTASIASSHRRLSVLGTAAAIVLGAALLAACGGGGGASGYPKGVQTSFVGGLASQGISKKDATCVLTWFESHRSSNEFQAESTPEGAQFQSDSVSALSACHVAVPDTSNSGDTGSGSDTNTTDYSQQPLVP